MRGTLYGVGVGPGDPELLTVKALRVLERCPVVAVPVTRSGQTLARDIAAQAADLGGKTCLELPFPMTADETARREAYENAWARLEEHLARGTDVAMPCLGDVSVYATFGGIRALARSHGYQTEAVPGVTSFCAAAASLGVSLAEGGEALHILPGRADGALGLPGTKVFLKSGRELPALLNALAERGLTERAMLVKNCGLAGEERVTDLSGLREPEKMGYFVTVIVKE